jgi:Rrf2 family protein
MLCQQSKYALRAVQHLGTLDRGAYHTVGEIAEATGLPAPYLAKVLKLLVKRELLISRRGKNGGVALNRQHKSKVTFLDVCTAVEDPIVAAECMLFKRPCSEESACAFHTKWSATKERLLQFLERERV